MEEDNDKIHHVKNNSNIFEIYKEAAEIVKDAKELEEKVIVFVTESKNFFEKMFECCNGRKDIDNKK